MGAGIGRAVRGIAVRSGNQTNCAGIAKIVADVEPAERFEFVDAHAPDDRWTDREDDELIEWCVAAVRRGVEAGLAEAGSPPVRFVLRRILVHPVDSNERHNEAVGRMAVAEALRRLSDRD
ncbi:hypothetical protein [Catenuloplanes japonicus]|uniref:hypothetical protein n=1 Tax=Catenuloplanes japonicus TaxID=33876 RepID=UPI0012F9EE86|nr:hypothetical protein [Catenuloplanes japonicus]